MESGASGNCNVGDYMTHPAFLSIPSKGFWVGKFETGYEGATTKEEAEVNERDASKIIVKPNVYSWRVIQAANAFYSSYDYKRNLDSHMMKNTEWGAVAYLQHSKYGSQTSVRLNNNSSFITGYQANNEPTCGYTGTNEECNRYCNDGSCNTAYPNSVLASTTNNISGIFDMSGGAWEYVLSFMKLENDIVMVGNTNGISGTSGFKGFLRADNSFIEGLELPSNKYYDLYNNSEMNMLQYSNRILGDATGEFGPFYNYDDIGTNQKRYIGSWYVDKANFLGSYGHEFIRGGHTFGTFSIGTEAGIFGFTSGVGEINRDRTFRLTLTPS